MIIEDGFAGTKIPYEYAEKWLERKGGGETLNQVEFTLTELLLSKQARVWVIEKGFYTAFVSKDECVLWMVYSEQTPDYREIHSNVSEFATEKGIKKITMYLKGEHYEGILKLLKEFDPKLVVVKVEVEAHG